MTTLDLEVQVTELLAENDISVSLVGRSDLFQPESLTALLHGFADNARDLIADPDQLLG